MTMQHSIEKKSYQLKFLKQFHLLISLPIQEIYVQSRGGPKWMAEDQASPSPSLGEGRLSIS